MSKYSIILSVCAFALPLAVVAQGGAPSAAQHAEHDQHAQSSGEAQSSVEPASGGHSMAAMHEHMQAMREQMARIHAAQDPEERERLMHEHMQSMQQHMQMMGRMGQGSEAGSRPETRCSAGDVACRTDELQSQHESMRQSMSEMRELMGQMMEHLRATTESSERRER